MALTDKDGKKLSVDGVDEKIVLLLDQVTDGLEGRLAAKLTTVEEAVQPLSELPAQVTKLTEALEAKPKDDKGENDDKDKNAGGGDEPPTWATKLIERVDGLASEREADKKASAMRTRVAAYLDAKRPNLSGKHRERVEARLLAIEPEDDKAIEKGLGDLKQEFADLGVGNVDTIFSADKAAENGDSGGGSDKDQAKREAMERIQKRDPASMK